ncbi:partial [Olea europaea subsp. europaea]|uniref:Partial (Chloroplast) n=1 Tax=Olea europaea subsp. europaea TaxID=158383 RepID=A0A8S0UQY6_OLEEU|nr:partial [Olea europaea subsp. europaea]
MVFFVVVQGVGLLLGMLRLLCSSSLDTFGMVLEPCSEMFFVGIDPDLDAQVEFGAFQKLGDPTTRRQVWKL